MVEAKVDWQTGRGRVIHHGQLESAHLERAVREASVGTRHHYRLLQVWHKPEEME